MQDPSKLLVWQKAHRLSVEIHRLTERWSRRDHSGLVGQVRRAALSIPSNIAEGCGRDSNRELARFLQIAIGSANELEYQVRFAADVGIIATELGGRVQSRIIEVRRMLIGLRKKVVQTQHSHTQQP